MMQLHELFKRQVLRELHTYTRQIRNIVNTSLFFLMIMIFFPLSMPADTILLRSIAPGLVWVAMLLAFFLSSERLFQQDYDDGIIEQWLVSAYPVSLYVIPKIGVHWLLNLLPMLILCPIIALFFGLNSYEMFVLMASLICGTPTILFLCGLSAIFGLGVKQKGVLMALILLPLAIPVMIFGSGTVFASMQNDSVLAYLALLLAFSLLSSAFLPMAIAGVMRISLVD